MNSGTIQGCHYRTRQPVCVAWEHGRITKIEPMTAGGEPGNLWLAPTLFDVQVNGYAGVDFQQDDLTVESLLHAACGLRRDGCARFFLTLITAEWSLLLRRLKHARELRRQSAELQSAIAGWHVEGPFLSEKPGFCGAHDSSVMIDPTPDHVRALREVTGTDRVLLTLAPERTGALEAIHAAVAAGTVVSLGHTDASVEILQQAVRAGASGFTHLSNGCPRELDRHDNIIWRVCDTEGLTVSLITDGIHVPRTPFRALHHALDRRLIYYTTDAMSAAGAPPGRYRLGKVELEVGVDQIVRQPGRSNFAGSALRPVQGVFRAADMLQCPWQECWQRMAEAPGRFVSVTNELAVGAPATFCVVEVDETGARTVQSFADGVCSEGPQAIAP